MIVVVSEGRDRPVSPSKRTRWLWVANRDGKPALAPGVRTHQLSLLFGMGLDWHKRAMAEPEIRGTEHVYGSIDVRVNGQPLPGLVSISYGDEP